MEFKIQSKNFDHKGKIPSLYTCEGKDISPQLSWAGAPTGTKSFALICDDPDAPDPKAPKMTWVHWVLYNIPASTAELKEAVRATDLPKGTKEGLNDWKRTGYGGPCPPIGEHRYFFKLYALSKDLPDLGTPTKQGLEKAMKDSILGKSDLLGTYEKQKR
ncbi:MAG TPA: YbhB/YbcL family Raf kinase inhibitor-like protein [Bdellovibrionota bacterium]|nr:YbhB/YbcL family Raf kinase inhibitor-like protein [Bdellovibrionota bacterium]